MRAPPPAAASAVPAHACRPDKELLTAWLLLLLGDSETHGYGLRAELEAHGLDIDSGAMYRLLRQLEGDGFVRSRWQASDSGPRRRSYRLTPTGRRRRDDVARTIATTRATHDAFLRAYDGLVREEVRAA